MSGKKILFVIGGSSKSVGGHVISTITLANYTSQKGYEVGLLLSPLASRIPELDRSQFKVHYKPCLFGKGALISRPFDIFQIVKKNRYEIIVAMDWYAGMYAGLASIWNKIPVVQVIAGGKGPPSSPLHLPGIVLFSEELVQLIPDKFGISPTHLILSSGRVDFNAFHGDDKDTMPADTLGFHPESPRVLTISRLTEDKAPAIMALFRQVEQFSSNRPIQCFVIGEGTAKPMLVLEAERIVDASGNRAEITFLGGFRVNSDHLRQADLVVGQGRTVIEAIASNVPAAVCGKNGYFGLLTEETLPMLAITNLTGRQLQPFSQLTDDIERLESYKQHEERKVYDLAFRMYDASLGAEALEKAIENLQGYYSQREINRWKLVRVWLDGWVEGFASLIRSRLPKNKKKA